jgi:outer membrane protein OmpA-like peptidoglycan-associated protein
MPGTLGASDIFKVAIYGEDSYGTPENLGVGINTEGRETFPYVTPENELYFASDGHPGLGGLDIFVSKGEKDGSFKDPINVGDPANSPKDDFALLLDTKTSLGFLTSNREGGMGSDDIYIIKETKKIEFNCDQQLAGSVVDQTTQAPITNARIVFMDANFKILKETTADEQGNFSLGKVECGAKYYIKIEAKEYTINETPILIVKTSGKTFVPVELEKTFLDLNSYFDPVTGKLKDGKTPPDLAKFFDIKNILFDLDKSNIRPDAEVELAKILVVLEDYPTMELDIRSHTDCRQTAKYNQALSDRRAKSTRTWLIGKGINEARLTAKGYGESQLVNNCGCEPTNESTCSEELHQQNRRSELLIIRK